MAGAVRLERLIDVIARCVSLGDADEALRSSVPLQADAVVGQKTTVHHNHLTRDIGGCR